MALASVLLLGFLAMAQAQGGPQLAPFLLPGCTIMFSAGALCSDKPTPVDKGCCPLGFSCTPDPTRPGGPATCVEKPAGRQTFARAAAAAEACSASVLPGGACGDASGPSPGSCCPDGFSCQAPAADSAVREFTCQADSSAPPLLAAAAAAAAVVPNPVPPLPADACACRVDNNGNRVPRACPSPWDHPAGTSRVLPKLTVDKSGNLVRAAGSGKAAPAALRGVNWFGWEVGAHNFDGLWAYCDDNSTSCTQDGEVPPSSFPSAAIGADGQNSLQIYYWKRRMTGDFASVAQRLRLLGINALRVPFTFSALADDLKDYSVFTACANDPDDYVALKKTLDPQYLALKPANLAVPPSYAYSGMAHPPPAAAGQDARCNRPWSAPFLDSYTSPSARAEWGSEFKLTMCNWYLPQGAGALGIHRFLWQLSYLVSQGNYIFLDYHPTSDDDPNMLDPQLFASNWGNLWAAVMAQPNSDLLAGRIVPDLVNEASRFGCQWDRACTKCAKGSDLVAAATAAIRAVDPNAIISVNALGQDGAGGCAGRYLGLNWGDGFITDQKVLQQTNISDPSFLFDYSLSDAAARQRLVAPHIYPSSITTVDPQYNTQAAARARWTLSWGKKAKGSDKLSNKKRAAKAAVVLGEFGVRDNGDNQLSNSDTTQWSATDVAWLGWLATYTRGQLGAQRSWMWWAYNANSGDTRGIVGPSTTWREVQWTKVRFLAKNFGLQPWYCAAGTKSLARKYGCA